LVLAVPVAAFFAHDWRETSGDLVTLATNLGEAEAQAACELLKQRRVPFELRDGGHTLLVPAVLRAELTIELSQIVGRTLQSRTDTRFLGDEGMPAQRGATSSSGWIPNLTPAQEPSGKQEAG